MNELEKTSKAFDALLTANIELYTHGTLIQYGLTEEQALEIVTNLTKIPKEKLIELKKHRTEKIIQRMQGDNSPAAYISNFVR